MDLFLSKFDQVYPVVCRSPVSRPAVQCLLCEHRPSEPDEDYALYGLGVQERLVMAFHLGCLCHSLLKMNAQDEQPWRDIHATATTVSFCKAQKIRVIMV